MKRIVFAMLMLAPVWSLAQEKQTVTVGSEEYDVLKSQGNLDQAHIKFLTVAPDESYQPITKKRDDVQLLGGDEGTDDPCNPWIQPGDWDDPNYPLEEGQNYSTVQNNSDDGSNGPFNLPFDFCFYGETYDQVYINNNGNLSFGASYGTFTPTGFPSDNYVMIAPFWGDVNMAAEGGECYYTITETAMYVNWIGVGYYGNTEPLNSNLENNFQVIITDGSDPVVPGGNNVSFAYLDMQWTTGTASQGINGFGGAAAQVGANAGDGTSYILFGQFSVDSYDYDGPFNEDDGVHWLDYKYFVFNTCTDSENIAPIYEGGACTDLVVCQGGAINLEFLAPEEDQEITIDYETEDDDLISVTGISNGDGTATVVIGVLDETPPGFYEILVTATDDFEADPGVTEIFYTLEVVEDDLPPVTITGPEGICPGQPATLTLEDADDYGVIQWSTGSPADQIFISEPGLYSLTATTDICLKYGEYELLSYEVPEPVFVSNGFTCEGSTTTVSLDQNYPTIVWNFNPNLNTQSVDLGEGTHVVAVTSDDGCVGSGEITIEAYPTTEISGGTVCGDTYEVVGTTDINGTWSFSGPGSVTDYSNPGNVNTDITVSEFGTYNFVFIDECDLEESISVEYLPAPNFTIADMQLCQGDESMVIPEGVSPELSSWEWSDGSSDPFILVTESGQYSFVATNDCGTSEGSANIIVLPCEVEVPDIFTPNEDGTIEDGFNNDYLVIKGLEYFPGSKLTILDRWGGVVYENDDYGNCEGLTDWSDCLWSPTADEAPEGVYYYVLDVLRDSGETDGYAGYIHIVR